MTRSIFFTLSIVFSTLINYKNLIEGFNSIEREFPLPEFQVSVVHGKMKPEDKEYEMKRLYRFLYRCLL